MTELLWSRVSIRHPWPDQRFAVNHPRLEPDGQATMSGSARGVRSDAHSYRNGCDFDRLHELVKEHRTLRLFLGHGAFSDEEYEYQTMLDNVCLVRSELLADVGQLVVESGHAVARNKPGEPLRGRRDSVVVETDLLSPTDAMRCLVRATSRAASDQGVAGWRQWRHLTRSVKRLFNQVRSTRRARPEQVEAHLERWRDLVERRLLKGETIP